MRDETPGSRANYSTMQARSTLARTLHGGGVLRALAIAAMSAGCVIPPSLSVDTADAAANSAPAIVSARIDNITTMEEFGTYNFEKGLGTLTLTVHDTDVDDKLYCKVFVDYNVNGDQTPARASSEAAGTTVDRTCTLSLAGLCLTSDIGQKRLMQVLVFDRTVLENGEMPLYQAMPAGGLSTSRTYYMFCQEPQQL